MFIFANITAGNMQKVFSAIPGSVNCSGAWLRRDADTLWGEVNAGRTISSSYRIHGNV